MFYSHDILQKRGKFGIIWLAATSRQRITKRDIWRVNVANTSEDIMNTVNRHPVMGQRTAPYSLYLSAQLMYGLVLVTEKQYEMLLEDLKCLIIKLGTFRIQGTSSIDLVKPVDEMKITMTPPNMDDVPFDFGSLAPIPEPTCHILDEFFEVSTPKSSEERSSTPRSFQHLPDFAIFLDDTEMLHIAEPADVTMQEIPFESEEPIPEEMPEEPVDFITDEPFLDHAPMEQIPSEPMPGAEHEPVPTDENLQFLLTPEAAVALDEPQVPSPGPFPNGDMTLQPAVEQQQREESLDTFVLAPVDVPGRRRRRRRHLIIDPVTTLSVQQIRSNMERTDNITVPFHQRFASLQELPEAMFRRLSTNFVPTLVRNRIRRLQTLRMPDDTLSYVISHVEEVPEAEMPRDAEVEPVADAHLAEETSEAMQVELPRDATDATIDPSISGLLKTSSLKAPGLSASASMLGKDITGSSILPMVEEELMPSPGVEIPEPVLEFPAESTEEALEKTLPSICRMSPVSPERTPPPSTIESLTASLEQTLQLINEVVTGSGIPGVTTFNAALLRITPNKRNVASLFNHLLHLHDRGMINVQQPVPDGEIFIKVLSPTLVSSPASVS